MDLQPVGAPDVLGLVDSLEKTLHQFAFGEGITADFQLPEEQLCIRLPENLQPLMDASVLSVLTARFGLASDEGPLEVAMITGKTILAIYLCIYPARYPLIGSCTSYTASLADQPTQVSTSSKWRRWRGTSA